MPQKGLSPLHGANALRRGGERRIRTYDLQSFNIWRSAIWACLTKEAPGILSLPLVLMQGPFVAWREMSLSRIPTDSHAILIFQHVNELLLLWQEKDSNFRPQVFKAWRSNRWATPSGGGFRTLTWTGAYASAVVVRGQPNVPWTLKFAHRNIEAS